MLTDLYKKYIDCFWKCNFEKQGTFCNSKQPNNKKCLNKSEVILHLIISL